MMQFGILAANSRIISDESLIKLNSDDEIKELEREMKNVKVLQISQELKDPLSDINSIAASIKY